MMDVLKTVIGIAVGMITGFAILTWIMTNFKTENNDILSKSTEHESEEPKNLCNYEYWKKLKDQKESYTEGFRDGYKCGKGN